MPTYLETSSLTGSRLLLHGHDLQNFIFQGRAQEEIDDLELLKDARHICDLDRIIGR